MFKNKGLFFFVGVEKYIHLLMYVVIQYTVMSYRKASEGQEANQNVHHFFILSVVYKSIT